MRSRALAALKEQRWQDAADCYRVLLDQADAGGTGLTASELADAAANQGAVLRKLGRSQDAFQHYQRWLSKFPQHTTLRLNGINCLVELGQSELARAWIDAGLKLTPGDIGLRQVQAQMLLRLGQPQQARRLLDQLTRDAPQKPGIWLDLSLACHRMVDRTAALAACQQASRLDPLNAGAWSNQINLLKELGQLEAAGQLADGLTPALRQHCDVRRALADLHMEQQLMAEAEAELQELCRMQPQVAGHWLNRAACLRHLKHFVAASDSLKRGLRWSPGDRQLQESLGHCLAEIGQAERGLRLLRQAFAWDHTLSDSSHTSLQFLGAGYGLIADAERRDLARAWEQRKQRQGVGPLWSDRIREPLAGRRLRIGYFSADLCDHPVGRFLLPLLKGHDRSRVEVFGLHCGPHRDGQTDALRQCCDHWQDLRFGSDLEVARQVADLNLDVLIELGGFTGLSRLGVVVHRPAPVQLSYLGYFAPTYLGAIDGWIGDAELFSRLSPIDHQAHRLIALEGGYMACRELDLPAAERAQDAAMPLRFGSFNHSRKLSSAAVALFCQVMAAVPHAELVLKSVSFIEPAERDRVTRLFTAAGLQQQRLRVLPWVEGRHNHLACYGQVDVALDPLPYGGATTTCEALLMGVPVVSLRGAGMVGCLSTSVLAAAGCSPWIADNETHYVAIARQLAKQGPRQAPTRQQLREQVQRSALGNGHRLAHALEEQCQTLAAAALQRLR